MASLESRPLLGPSDAELLGLSQSVGTIPLFTPERPATPPRQLIQLHVPHRGFSHAFSHVHSSQLHHGYLQHYHHRPTSASSSIPHNAFTPLTSTLLQQGPHGQHPGQYPQVRRGRPTGYGSMSAGQLSPTRMLLDHHQPHQQQIPSIPNSQLSSLRSSPSVESPGVAANGAARQVLLINEDKSVAAADDRGLGPDGADKPQLSQYDLQQGGSKAGLYSFYAFVILGFFWVSGGCYGNEELFAAAPPNIVFGCLLITPFIFSLPLALTTVELSAAMPYDGGQVSWVHVVMGPRVGGHNSYWHFVGYCIDSSIYPLLAGQYISSALPDNNAFRKFVGFDNEAPIIGSVFVILVTGIKLLGTDVLVKFNSILITASLLPVLIFIFWTMPDWDVSAWLQGSKPDFEVDYSLLLAWQIWLYSGFSSLGCLASEVERPQRTMTKALLILLPISLLVNMLPLMASLALDRNWEDYHVGYFEVVATNYLGRWLGIWMTVGVQLVMLGLFNGGAMVADRSLAQLMTTRFKWATIMGSQHRSRLWRWLVDDTTHGVGPIFEIITMLLNLVLVWLPYALLVEVGVLLIAVSTTLQIVIFVWLRVKRPRMHRPFKVGGGGPGGPSGGGGMRLSNRCCPEKVPGGDLGAFLCCLGPTVIMLTYTVIAFVDSVPTDVMGMSIPYLKPISFFVILFFGIAVNLIYNYCWGCGKATKEEQEELGPGTLDEFPDDPPTKVEIK